MNPKKIFLAIIVAGLILLIQFRIIPKVKNIDELWKPKFISPDDGEEVFKFKLKSAVKAAGFEIIDGPFSKKEIDGIQMSILKNNEPIKIFFSASKDIQFQLASLQLIFKEAKIVKAFRSGSPPKQIDLTGDKPYVSF